MNLDRFILSCLCALGLLISGCGDADDELSYGEWTVAEDSLRLTEDLRVSETEDFYFGSATSLDVTSDGRMVVADRQASNIKVLRPDGILLDTLGGPGEGPGEFQQLTSVQIARGDSLYAYDIRRSRLTVFAPDSPYEMGRTVMLPGDAGFPLQVWIRPNAFLAMYSSLMQDPEEGVSQPSSRAVRRVHSSGEPRDTILRHPGPRMATVESGGGGFRVRTIPFERNTNLDLGPEGTLYHGWSDSLHIQTRTISGESEVVASIPTEPVPVTEAARDSALANLDGEMRTMVVSGLPDTKPAFTQMVVADDGRIWIQRPTEAPDAETAPWWVLNPDTKTIQKTRLPSAVSLTVVTDEYAYGTTQTDLGAPAVVRYRIES